MPLVINGWTLLYHPVFGARLRALRDRVKRLKATRSDGEFDQHPDVKLLAVVNRLVTKTVPADPNARDFLLKAGLAKYRRVKGHGLPDRYRLFYLFSEQMKTIVFLYLNDSGTLRKERAKTDPYEVFTDLVRSGKIGADFDENLRQWNAAHAGGSQGV